MKANKLTLKKMFTTNSTHTDNKISPEIMSNIMDTIKAESFNKDLEGSDGKLRYYCKIK